MKSLFPIPRVQANFKVASTFASLGYKGLSEQRRTSIRIFSCCQTTSHPAFASAQHLLLNRTWSINCHRSNRLATSNHLSLGIFNPNCQTPAINSVNFRNFVTKNNDNDRRRRSTAFQRRRVKPNVRLNTNVGSGGADTYAIAVLTPNTGHTKSLLTKNTNAKLSLKSISIEQILKEAPGTQGRDFFSLQLTSEREAASRKMRDMSNDYHYSIHKKIHPWFILPRESEIVMSFGCVRAIITRKSAYIFDAHKPTIKQQALRISQSVQRKDCFTLNDGQIIFHQQSSNKKSSSSHFELNMVEEIIREVCTMYRRRIRLYEPIVNSLMDRVANEAFSPAGLHKLVPVKDSLQHFEMNVKGAIRCITDLLSNDEDMLHLLLTEKSIAISQNQELPLESHESVELLLEEYGRQLNSILLEIGFLLQRVQSKQDMVALSLDAYRNRIIMMNLYLSVGGIALGFGTAVAGFFGMNLVNGYEEVEGVFGLVVMGSCVLGGGFMGACFSYLDGSRTKNSTIENLNQIEIMNRALSDMPALDYSFELMLNEDGPLTKEKFREKIFASEPESIRDSEIDFLFDLLDYTKDNVIDKEDFRSKIQ